jgi:hypothetical protein
MAIYGLLGEPLENVADYVLSEDLNVLLLP